MQNEVAQALSLQNNALLSTHVKAKNDARSFRKEATSRSRAGTGVDMDVDDTNVARDEDVQMDGTSSSLLVEGTEYIKSGIIIAITLCMPRPRLTYTYIYYGMQGYMSV